jgi:hypothetical protein
LVYPKSKGTYSILEDVGTKKADNVIG